MSGQFGFMGKIGATDEAVATLNDQPYLFTILVVVLVILILQSVLLWYIHYATMKPEQKKKKEPKDKMGGPKFWGLWHFSKYLDLLTPTYSRGNQTYEAERRGGFKEGKVDIACQF